MVTNAFTQIISGIVTDSYKEALPGANVFIKDSYYGGSTNESGTFHFKADMSGHQILHVRFIGYKEYLKEINCDADSIYLNITLKENAANLNAVTITAGTFRAGDKKKGVLMRPIDVVTTAGGLGDIYGAMQTLPGTSIVGEDGRLFVRGGDSYETKTFFDGLAVEKPYFSNMPDIPTRGRFSPWLFSGTTFSAGGYSAEYGQALSSAMIMESSGLAHTNSSSISLMSIGLGGNHTQRFNNSSLSISGNYTDLSPYYGIINQYYNWEKAPSGIDGNLVFRQKTGKSGLIKTYVSYSQGKSALYYPDTENQNEAELVKLEDKNIYLNTTYRGMISKKFSTYGGLSYSNDKADYTIGKNKLNEGVKTLEAKYTITYLMNKMIKIKTGAGFISKYYNQTFRADTSFNDFISKFNNNLAYGFSETEINLNANIAIRAGIRGEYASYIHELNVAPRLSLAFKTGKYSQFSLAYGSFYQLPEDKYLSFDNNLVFEKADHYIFNYQISKNKNIFRIEAYYKLYKNLIKYQGNNEFYPVFLKNSGEGYARGIDLFWRNRSSDNLDFWISYSFIDSERDFRNYPEMAIPPFISKHNARAVVKYYFPKINTQLGLTYSFASGRYFNNPNTEQFMDGLTKSYNDLSVNLSYLIDLFNNFTIIHLSMSNLLGTEQIFGYNFSDYPDSGGNYNSVAIKPTSKRFIFLGIFISLRESNTISNN